MWVSGVQWNAVGELKQITDKTLNRLSTAINSAGPSWGLSYQYDGFGIGSTGPSRRGAVRLCR
jgi:hypothetical protein